MNRPKLNAVVTEADAILADLEVALTLAASAELKVDLDSRNAIRASARHAYFYLRDELCRLRSATDLERAQINAKLGRLRSRLERLGEKFDQRLRESH